MHKGRTTVIMTIDIICPNCNYSKTVPREKIPEGVRYANCPRCGERFEFTPLKPAFGLEAEGDKRGAVAASVRPLWEIRSESGIWRSIYETGKSVLFSPGHFFGSLKQDDGIKEPFAFGLLFRSLGNMFGSFWQFLLFSGGSISFMSVLEDPFRINLIFLGIMIISPLFAILNMFFMGGMLHLCLRIVGGAKGYFESTFRVVAYTQVTRLFSFIPFIGGFIGFIWHLIILIVGLRAIHDTSFSRVIIALLLPLGLILVAVAAIVISIDLFL